MRLTFVRAGITLAEVRSGRMAEGMEQIERPPTVEIRHATDSVVRRVRAWFERTTEGHRLGILDGSRSVLLPHPDRRDALIKIKGAGLLGEAIRFGKHPRTGPMAVTFDFDGRMMEDVASGHDNAVLGGASFQQASTEYRVSSLLRAEGHAVVPCLGYGSITTPGGLSWFSVFEWRKDWSGIGISASFPAEQYLAVNVELVRRQVEIAIRHNLVGYIGYVKDGKGDCLIKDLHPFRRLDPINHSQLSWTLELLHALWVRCSACRFFGRAGGVDLEDNDLSSIPLRALVADATARDYSAFETMIVRPYLHSKPDASFDSAALYDALRRVRVAEAALALCPQEYARFAS
jgi:hypothetical protein